MTGFNRLHPLSLSRQAKLPRTKTSQPGYYGLNGIATISYSAARSMRRSSSCERWGVEACSLVPTQFFPLLQRKREDAYGGAVRTEGRANDRQSTNPILFRLFSLQKKIVGSPLSLDYAQRVTMDVRQ